MVSEFYIETGREIRRKFFDQEDQWCELSERRLLLKLVLHKPTGLQRHYNLNCLVDYLNHIYDDEEDTDFEDYLSSNDLELLRSRILKGVTGELMTFPPTYSIRPTVKQVEEKLNEFFDMELIHENEPLPDQLSTGNDFTLPESINITPDEPRTSITPEKSIHTGSNESRFIEQTLPFSLLMSKIVKTPAKKRKHSEDRPPSGSSTPSSAKRSKVT